jgi:hypothetical protein
VCVCVCVCVHAHLWALYRMLLLVHLHTIVTSASYYVWSNDTVIHQLEKMWKEVVVVYFEQYTDMVEGLKCHKNQIEISRWDI